ncbi:MAG: ATP-binding protein [Epsilonproteobacteria bacterium]|nr:ATP-binding protein [Campylobacterota bacterium]
MNKIYFFNSANFSFAQIDLQKRNIFFVGDNGSGKTTAIRAIHYFYNSDMKALGIDPNKESFKEFYFKYDNSFMVYEFDDYFVLMYKSSGNINRIFSRGRFDLNRVLEGDEVKDIREVIKYAKENGFIVKTNDEYKKIIYGINTKMLDFKIATIKNYPTFINLYNKIFNVNKAVFDSKSIKETIFTTLERVEMGEINYEDFANELTEYRHFFAFYRKFASKEAEIQKLYDYKNTLLKLSDEIQELLEKIAYKKDVEEKELSNTAKAIEELNKKIRFFYKQSGYIDNKIKNIEKNINKELLEIAAKLEEIETLKSIYTLEKIQAAQKKAAQKEELQKKLITLQTSLNELAKGIKTQVEEVEEEIERLKREKRILKEKQKEEEIRIKRNLSEKYEQIFEELKEKFEEEEKQLFQKTEEILKEITDLESKEEEFIKQKRDVNLKFQQKEDELKESIQEEKRALLDKKRALSEQKENLKDEISKLKRLLKKDMQEFEEKKEALNEKFKKELKLTQEKIAFYKEILKTTPNSFKEFLNQNVENWEESLYPIIDESLLSKSVDELKPRIIAEPVVGIAFETSSLKTIPTMKEAEEQIEKLNAAVEAMKKDYETDMLILEKDFSAKKIETESKIEVNQEKIKEIDISLNMLQNELNELNAKLTEALEKLNSLKLEEIKLIEININSIKQKISSKRKEMDEVKRQIKKLKKDLNKQRENLKKEEEKEFKKSAANLKEEFVKKEKALSQKIDQLISKKEKVSKDERINELNIEIKNIQNRLKDIEKAQIFLKEWEAKKNLIERQNPLKEQQNKYQEYLKRLDEFYEKIMKKINLKIKAAQDELKNKEETLEMIKEGLKEVKHLKLPKEKKQTNEFLSILIKQLRKKEGEFSDTKRYLTESANNIKIALSPYAINGLDVNFNLENLAKMVDEELERVDELYIFKDKKFDVLKKTRIKGLKNLIGGIMDKKLESFKEAKEDFLRQIKRINQNLKEVNFGIVRNIKIEIEETNRSILKIFDEIKTHIESLNRMLEDEAEFFESRDNDRKLKRIEELFNEIKKEINSPSFSLVDVVDINVKFIENEKENYLKVIKNESSTGGSILLKIAIAVSMLELFIKEKANLFLILDEVSVLSTKNQKLLKDFVNQRGLGVIYVTPDLPLVDVEDIDIYKFRNVGGEFEVVKLISPEGIKIDNLKE